MSRDGLQQFIRFSIVGIFNTCVDYGLYNLAMVVGARRSGLEMAIASAMSITAAATLSFTLNRRWTFRTGESNANTQAQALRFLAVTGAGIVLNTTIVWGILAELSWDGSNLLIANLAKLSGGFLSLVWNFLAYRSWVFGASARTGEDSGLSTERCSRHGSAGLEVGYGSGDRGLVTVVIPAYNEGNRLPTRLERLAQSLPKMFSVEILVVNDGSTDATEMLARSIASRYSSVRVEGYERNRGKGAAVRYGVLASKGDFVVYTDADETFTEEHILQIVKCLWGGAPLVIASRDRAKGHGTEGESVSRSLMGRVFNLLVRALLLPGIHDTQCGLKGFTAPVGKAIFRELRTDGFAFDVELLVAAASMGIRLVEVPVIAKNCDGSRVGGLRTPLQMAWDVLRIKRMRLRSWEPFPLELDSAQETGSAGSRMAIPAVCLLLFAIGLGARLPWLQLVPRYLDELKEVNLGLAIADGRALPLHNVAEDIGALHNYILAAIFAILGPNIAWARLYTAVTGALTVPVLYLLGSAIGGRWTGVVAALALATNGMHILVTHKAWANCTTPFFATLAMLSMIYAEQKRSGWWLVAAGLLWALALQTHSSAIVYITAAATYALSKGFRRRSGLRRSWYTASVGAFILGYLNMIVFNIQSRGGSVLWLSRKAYTIESHPGLTSYLRNLDAMVVELVRTIGSIYSSRVHTWDYLTHPTFVLSLLLLIYGSREALRRGVGLLVYVVGFSLLTIPWLNSRYGYYILTRYIMTAAVAALLLASLGLVALVTRVARRLSPPKARGLIAGAWVILSIALTWQLALFYSYCDEMSDTNDSNQMALQAVRKVQEWTDLHNPRIFVARDLPFAVNPMQDLLALTGRRCTLVSEGAWSATLTHLSSDRPVVVVIATRDLPQLVKTLSRSGNRPEVVRYSCRRVFPPYRDTPRPKSVGTNELCVVRGTT